MRKEDYRQILKELHQFLRQRPTVLSLPAALLIFAFCFSCLWQQLELRQQELKANIQNRTMRVAQLESYASRIGSFEEYRAKRDVEIKVLEKKWENSRGPVEQLRFLQAASRTCSLTVSTLRQEHNNTDRLEKTGVEGFKLSLTGDYFNILRWLKLLEENSQARFYSLILQGNDKSALITLEAFITF